MLRWWLVFGMASSRGYHHGHAPRHAFIEILEVFWSDGSPYSTCNFFYSFLQHCLLCSLQHISEFFYSIFKKYVRFIKLIKFSNWIFNSHLSIFYRLEMRVILVTMGTFKVGKEVIFFSPVKWLSILEWLSFLNGKR